MASEMNLGQANKDSRAYWYLLLVNTRKLGHREVNCSARENNLGCIPVVEQPFFTCHSFISSFLVLAQIVKGTAMIKYTYYLWKKFRIESKDVLKI